MSVMRSVFAGVDTTVFTDASQDFSRTRWQEYPLGLSGFNIANKAGASYGGSDDWNVTNPDAATLRIHLRDDTAGHGISQGFTDGLFLVIPTPISSFCPPGVATLSSYRTTCAISVEWDWTPVNVRSMGICCGIINVDGSSAISSAGTYRYFRKTAVNNVTDGATCTATDVSLDSSGGTAANASTSATPADTIGMKVIMGGGGRTMFNMCYDWKDASYNKQESNFGDLTTNKGSGFFSLAETWDGGTDKISSANFYFFLAFVGTGTQVDNQGPSESGIIDVKKIQYFVHSIGDWYK